jgi:hypothetical protein
VRSTNVSGGRSGGKLNGPLGGAQRRRSSVEKHVRAFRLRSKGARQRRECNVRSKRAKQRIAKARAKRRKRRSFGRQAASPLSHPLRAPLLRNLDGPKDERS